GDLRDGAFGHLREAAVVVGLRHGLSVPGAPLPAVESATARARRQGCVSTLTETVSVSETETGHARRTGSACRAHAPRMRTACDPHAHRMRVALWTSHPLPVGGLGVSRGTLTSDARDK